MRIQRLDWDTDFFGYPVGRLWDCDGAASSGCIQQCVRDSGCHVVYACFQALRPDLAEHYVLTQVELRLWLARWLEAAIDQATSELSFSGQCDAGSVLINRHHGPADNELRMLALQAGWSSRFALDSRFGRTSYESLYTRWIERSCALEIADAVLTATLGQSRVGLVTGQLGAPIAGIGLLSVETESRGVGVGRRLLECFASLAIEAGCLGLSVVTQAENVSALRLYSRVGFEEVRRRHWYHIWSNAGEQV